MLVGNPVMRVNFKKSGAFWTKTSGWQHDEKQDKREESSIEAEKRRGNFKILEAPKMGNFFF